MSSNQKPCIVKWIFLITVYENALVLIMLAPSINWSSISRQFSLILGMVLDISTKYWKYYPQSMSFLLFSKLFSCQKLFLFFEIYGDIIIKTLISHKLDHLFARCSFLNLLELELVYDCKRCLVVYPSRLIIFLPY